MEEFKHDKYTRKAIELVRLGRSFFITGKAGTGKTTLLKEIVKDCHARGKKIAVSAPTGIAAMNAGGQTLHSLFGLKPITFIPGKTHYWFRKSNKIRKVIENIDILIIDEISMVRCDCMDMVDHALRYYKRSKKPFGGIQVVLFGDLFQLPPVVTDKDEGLLYSYYEKGNPYFFSSDVIRRHPLSVLELETVHRQPDKNFVDILNRIRVDVYLDSDIKEINKRLKFDYEPSPNESGVFLRTIRYNVKKYNNRKLSEITGKREFSFSPEIVGKFPKKYFPTDDPLKLKVGAKVMLLRNDNDGYNFVNGTQGIIKDIGDYEISVETDEGKTITVGRSTWELYRYEWVEETKTIIPKVKATFTQYPIKLAWAVTIHKSQGMTFSKVIIDAHNSFATGQVYVALSRCRSLEGITLTSKITENDIMVDPKVVEYMESVERINPIEAEIESEKDEQQSDYVLGHYFETLSESHITESKPFCFYKGKNHCRVVMTSKGFFLKIIDGGYYFLSEIIDENIYGSIWVQNKKGRLSDYPVSYSTDGMTPNTLGIFFEGYSPRTLRYLNLRTYKEFSLDLNSGKITRQ